MPGDVPIYYAAHALLGGNVNAWKFLEKDQRQIHDALYTQLIQPCRPTQENKNRTYLETRSVYMATKTSGTLFSRLCVLFNLGEAVIVPAAAAAAATFSLRRSWRGDLTCGGDCGILVGDPSNLPV